MNKIDEVTKKILESATTEFFLNGFEKASMRIIAKKADVTTGALYARFPNKDALMGAIVDPVIEKFWEVNEKSNQKSIDKINVDKIDDMWSDSNHLSSTLVNLIYANKTIFSILINGANGSKYEKFIDTIVAYEEKDTRKMMDILKEKGYPFINVSDQVIHMLISAHCYALFEIVRHDLPKEDALMEVLQINEFFNCGWNRILGI